MTRVFLSYSHKDLSQVEDIEATLKECPEISVWRDQEKIYGGQKWPKVLGEAIADQDIFLLAWSKHSAASHFVEFEWNTAIALKRPIVPCLLDDTPLAESLMGYHAHRVSDVAGILKTLRSTVPADSARRGPVISKLNDITALEHTEVLEQAKTIFSQQEWTVKGNVYQAGGDIHIHHTLPLPRATHVTSKRLIDRWQTWGGLVVMVLTVLTLAADLPGKLGVPIFSKHDSTDEHAGKQVPSGGETKVSGPMPNSRTATEIIGEDDAPMVLILAGEFLMGSPDGEGNANERPRHRVVLDAFYLDKFEVTNQRFKEFYRRTHYLTTAEHEGKSLDIISGKTWRDVKDASWRKPEGANAVTDSGLQVHPVVHVSWKDAHEYCRLFDKRLPTEAEFEYSARAGVQTTFWWGNDAVPGPRRVGNVSDESAGRRYEGISFMQGYNDGYARTAPAGSYEANFFGLHDMIGNVWEWTSDSYDGQYYVKSPIHNPVGAPRGTERVLRGGSWASPTDHVRSAFRDKAEEGDHDSTFGFRCAKNVQQKP